MEASNVSIKIGGRGLKVKIRKKIYRKLIENISVFMNQSDILKQCFYLLLCVT